MTNKTYSARPMMPKLIRKEQGSECLFLANALLMLPRWTCDKSKAYIFPSAPVAQVHCMDLNLLHPELVGSMQII